MREKTKKELKKWKETERVKKGNIRDKRNKLKFRYIEKAIHREENMYRDIEEIFKIIKED